jgi:hypothetical protein
MQFNVVPDYSIGKLRIQQRDSPGGWPEGRSETGPVGGGTSAVAPLLGKAERTKGKAEIEKAESRKQQVKS